MDAPAEVADSSAGGASLAELTDWAVKIHGKAPPRLYKSLLRLYGRLCASKRMQLLQQVNHLKVSARRASQLGARQIAWLYTL